MPLCYLTACRSRELALEISLVSKTTLSQHRNIRVCRSDLAAWVSALSFGGGLAFANPADSKHDVLNGGTGLYMMLAAFAVFLAVVILVQRQLRLSLLANSFGSPRGLVTNGLFRFSRNPIYLAFLVPLASIAYVSLLAALGAGCLYIAVMNAVVIRPEERELMQVFGAEYAAYQAAVPRWLIR